MAWKDRLLLLAVAVALAAVVFDHVASCADWTSCLPKRGLHWYDRRE